MKKNRITKLTAAGLGFVTLATAGMVNQANKANAQKTKVTEPKIESMAHNAGVAAVPNQEREIATLRVETSNGKAAPLFSQDGTKLTETVSVGNVYQISKAAEIDHNVMFKILGRNQYIKASDTNIDGIQVINADNGVNLVDGEGHVQSQKVYTKSKFKIFEVKTIKGKVAYRLGTNKQWIMSPNAELFSIKDFAAAQARANAIIAQQQAKIRQAAQQQAAINAQIQAQNNARAAAATQTQTAARPVVSQPVAIPVQTTTRPVATSNNTQVAVPSQAPVVRQSAAPQAPIASKPSVTPTAPVSSAATTPVTPSVPSPSPASSSAPVVTPSTPVSSSAITPVVNPSTPASSSAPVVTPTTSTSSSASVVTPSTPSQAPASSSATKPSITPSVPASSAATTPVVTPSTPSPSPASSSTPAVTPSTPASSSASQGSTAPASSAAPASSSATIPTSSSATKPASSSAPVVTPSKPSVPQGAYDYNTNIHIDNPQAYLKAVRASFDFESPMFDVMTPELKEITKKGLEQNKALDPSKDNRKVDLMHITPAQQIELSEYAIAVVNSVRHQLGLSSWVYDSKVQGFANDIAKYYNEDNWSIADLNRSHDKHAITKAGREHGIQAYIAYPEDSNVSEDEAGFSPYNAYANGSQDTSSTMGEIKANIYWNLEQMFFGDIMTTDPQKATPIEFGHAANLIEEDEEFYGKPNKDGSILAAFSISYLPGKRTATTHYITNKPGDDGLIQR